MPIERRAKPCRRAAEGRAEPRRSPDSRKGPISPRSSPPSCTLNATGCTDLLGRGLRGAAIFSTMLRSQPIKKVSRDSRNSLDSWRLEHPLRPPGFQALDLSPPQPPAPVTSAMHPQDHTTGPPEILSSDSPLSTQNLLLSLALTV